MLKVLTVVVLAESIHKRTHLTERRRKTPARLLICLILRVKATVSVKIVETLYCLPAIQLLD